MITCKIMGGLGNQLFQIFTVISLSLEKSIPFFFFNEYQLGNENCIPIRYTYWNTFLEKLKIFLKDKNSFNMNTFIVYKEKTFEYNSLIKDLNLNLDNNILLFGYFQSYLYFHKHKKQICNLIGLDKIKDEIIKDIKNIEITNKINPINCINFNNTIALHFRLGDYLKIQDKHPILSKIYYENALNYILQNKTTNIDSVIYFCELEDIELANETIEYLKIVFKEYNITFKYILEINVRFKDWIQMLIISLCKYNIIANSTFSWWGAYFNENNGSIVCYPDLWFGKDIPHNTCDLCPENWKKVNNENI